MLEKSIEKRHRHELFVGTWRKEKVLVKVYPPKYEMFYFTETEFYQVRRPHAFISLADRFTEGGGRSVLWTGSVPHTRKN